MSDYDEWKLATPPEYETCDEREDDMSDDYEEGDPMEEAIEGKEMAAPPAPGFRLTIEASQWDETRITDAVLTRVVKKFEDKLEKAIDTQLDAAVDAAVKRVVEGRIDAMAEKVLEEGWTKTDEYGRPTGQKVTFAERVHGILCERGTYERNGRIDRLVTELAERALNKEMKPEIDAAKLKVQELLNGTLSAKLLQAMKEGVGLKG